MCVKIPAFASFVAVLFVEIAACQRAEPASTPFVAPTPTSASPRASSRVRSRVLRVGFTVSNLDRAVRALEALEFRRISDHEPPRESLSTLYGLPNTRARVAELSLGSETVELTECLTNAGRAIPTDSHSNDAWFQHLAIVVRDMDGAFARVSRHSEGPERAFGPLSSMPQTIPLSNAAAGGIRAFYFRDADAHNLELIWFPTGKGQPHWQRPGTELFLGIDHTAIAVSDGERGKLVYGALGFQVVGTSLNFGAEQQALSGVPGARVAITGLRDTSGPGVELLSYLAPTNGRRAPVDGTPCDLWHWETTIAVDSIEAALTELRPQGITASSPSITTFADDALGYRRAVLVHDPDGHALRLVQP